MKITDLVLLGAVPIVASTASMVAIQVLEPKIPITVVYGAGAVIAAGSFSIVAFSGILVHILRGIAEEMDQRDEEFNDGEE